MISEQIVYNLSNPTLLFFLLGILAVLVKSDLEIPEPIVKFIALYLLFSIGFKGGQELQHTAWSSEIIFSLAFGLFVSAMIPLYCFFILKRKVGVSNAGALAAAYGSVSAVTFVTAVNYLEMHKVSFGGHMIAVMALMEFPAIIMGFILIRKFEQESSTGVSLPAIVKHAFSNGSVLMLIGSLLIGILSDSLQAEGIKPFTTDIFKGFLALFLLEMGMITARRFDVFKKQSFYVKAFAVVIPAINGCLVAFASGFITQDVGNRFVFAVLAASASYIAVPAAMRMAAPQSDPGLYIPMALGVTFPFNITIGMPLYYCIVNSF